MQPLLSYRGCWHRFLPGFFAVRDSFCPETLKSTSKFFANKRVRVPKSNLNRQYILPVSLSHRTETYGFLYTLWMLLFCSGGAPGAPAQFLSTHNIVLAWAVLLKRIPEAEPSWMITDIFSKDRPREYELKKGYWQTSELSSSLSPNCCN